MAKPGIVLCSRMRSRRLPNKPLIEFCGKPAITILCERLLRGPYPVCLATPSDAEDDVLHKVTKDLSLSRFRGHTQNVLARFYWAAKEYDFDPIVRVTHDDLFVDTCIMQRMVEDHIESKRDYTYVSQCLRGADCEVVSRWFVERALKLHGDQQGEYLSYTFRRPELEPKMQDFTALYPMEKIHGRLVLDWPDDELAICAVFESVGTYVPSSSLYGFIRQCPSILKINELPRVSVYTCAHNAEAHLWRAIESVKEQEFQHKMEYIVLDDGSTDKTSQTILSKYDAKWMRPMRLVSNVGLASACNIALKDAKGKYFLRLDADDELLPGALNKLYDQMEANPTYAAIYPSYFLGDRQTLTSNGEHHMGGAMIRAWAWHELKFCDGLRHMEGQEFFNRLSKRYHYGTLEQPTWIYHATPGSMSKSQPEERARLKEFIWGTSLTGQTKHWSDKFEGGY